MLGKLICVLLLACIVCVCIGYQTQKKEKSNSVVALKPTTLSNPHEPFTDFIPFNCPIKCQDKENDYETPNRRSDGFEDDWSKLEHEEEFNRRARSLQIKYSEPEIREIDPEHTQGFVLKQPLYTGKPGGNPVCLPSKPLEKKPVHLDNIFPKPDDITCIDPMLPKFEYKEIREW